MKQTKASPIKILVIASLLNLFGIFGVLDSFIVIEARYSLFPILPVISFFGIIPALVLSFIAKKRSDNGSKLINISTLNIIISSILLLLGIGVIFYILFFYQ